MAKLSPKDFFSLLKARSAEIIDESGFRKKLASGRALRVKLGIDPTTPDLHLGHVAPLRILRAFQDAGHHAVLIIGDFTGQIGDPSGKTRTRRQLTEAEAKANERTYQKQASRVLDLKKTEVRHNSEWHSRMRLADFLKVLANFSFKSAWVRDDFQKRVKSGREVRLHEAVYHVLQAYDSVMVRADVEIGSLDQKLNLLAGRELQQKLGQKPQDIILVPYLIGLDGRQKMSKSVGNTVDLSDSAEDMFGKVMSIPDSLIINYAELAAWLPAGEIKAVHHRLETGRNPRDIKLDVAEAVTALYYGAGRARETRDEFLRLFSKKEIPDSIPQVRLKAPFRNPIELLLALKAASSKSEARRLLAGGAVEADGRVITSPKAGLSLRRGSVIRVGKKKFFRVM